MPWRLQKWENLTHRTEEDNGCRRLKGEYRQCLYERKTNCGFYFVSEPGVLLLCMTVITYNHTDIDSMVIDLCRSTW